MLTSKMCCIHVCTMYVLTGVGIELSQTLIWTGKRQSKTKQKYEIEHLVATSKRCS